MDGNRFDDLARGLAASRSRRGVLKGLAGAALAAIGLDRLDGAAEARAVCRDEGHPCEGNQTCCAGLACVASGRGGARRCARPATPSACPHGHISCGGACIPACTASDQCHVAGECDPTTGACTNPAKPDGTPCDDGNACTQTDTCQAGVCVGGNPVVCAASDQCHVAGECNPASGRCSHPDAPDGTSCNDGNACTGGDHCRSGRCVGGVPVACEASGPCTTATCDPDKGCVESNKPAGVACADADACNGMEHCDGDGNCVAGQPVSCGPCLICDSTSGSCAPDPAQVGQACPGDGDKCHGDFQCTASGACAATTTVTCQPLDQCHVAGTCDPATGVCDNPNAADGVACEDGNLCTTGDTCKAGVCTSGDPVTCDMPHTFHRCDPSVGCVVVSCAVGYQDCNHDLSDGCETHTMTEVDNCGACFHVCPSSHGTPHCLDGTCFITCDDGWANCDNSQTTGCQTNLKTSNTSCGTCGNRCANGHCVDGACVSTCGNGVKDGTETDVDCGGPECPACANGKTCLVNGDCATNTCHNGICADRICTANEVSWRGHCVYLDGSGGKCDPGYVMNSDNILAEFHRQFIGLTYKHQVSTDCCIQSSMAYESWGMGNHCNKPGPFDETDVVLGGSGCTNKQNHTPGQLTLCYSM